MTYLSLNTWSLHRHLGPLRWTYWNEEQQTHGVHIDPQPELTTLLELPALLAAKGFAAVDICHFNFPRTDSDYLDELKQALAEAKVAFHTLLLDYGDISSADVKRSAADMALARQWIDIAAQTGAKRIRIVAGESPPEDREALDRAGERLLELAAYAKPRNIRVITENFRSLSYTAANCLQLAKKGGGEIGMIGDFGNFDRSVRYEELSALLPICENVHAKPELDANGIPDEAEFARLLQLLKDVRYEGPVAMIYDGPGDMWEGIERVKAIAEPYVG
ncbi:sugar phosphate isomerase/epimerase [Paenibacillus sp. NEAU-GSW1]|uniref:sugar phosphate isomerase/epimerase family protein n=1 Tax=Paenibacillus sp. NEAU-GSW1 TaxID=2682486 RepID=UPI0012E12D09|nr:TIM barrel protein [Paenibacillus sp. NEAU-GSW1]MUT66512.1 TIM barrel protein [Paenibacillus sp. NEAU-GSW1]